MSVPYRDNFAFEKKSNLQDISCCLSQCASQKLESQMRTDLLKSVKKFTFMYVVLNTFCLPFCVDESVTFL